MVFDRSGEVRSGIEEACYSYLVLCEDLDECWRTDDSWRGLMTESFNGGGTGITCDDKSLLFELVALLLNHGVSRGAFCEDLDNCWRTEGGWGGFITQIFNGGGTYITSDEKIVAILVTSLAIKASVITKVFRCLPWLFHVPLFQQLPIPFWHGMMNAIWVCGGVVCLLLFLLISFKRWEPTFWRDNCSLVWVSVLGIRLIMICLYQYHPN